MSRKSDIPGLGWCNNPVFQLGASNKRRKTMVIPMEVHKAARFKLIDEFIKRGIHQGIVLLQVVFC